MQDLPVDESDKAAFESVLAQAAVAVPARARKVPAVPRAATLTQTGAPKQARKYTKPKQKARRAPSASSDSDDSGSSMDSFIVSSDEDDVVKPSSMKKRRASVTPADADYVSNALPVPVDDSADDGAESAADDDESDALARPEYVIGDATQPSAHLGRTNADGSAGAVDTRAVVVHCVDTSGAWGSGGMFTSLDALYGLLMRCQFQNIL